MQISNFDEGHEFERDSLAGSLRTLFCRGDGNDAIRRFCRRFSVQQPVVHFPKRISKTGNLFFGFSTLGADKNHDDTESISLPDQLAEKCCVLVRHKNVLHHIKWEDLVYHYGNTFGNHLSKTIPEFFDQVQVHRAGIGHVDFGAYMLRNLAVAVAECCHQLLEPMSEETFKSHSRYFNGSQVHVGAFYRKITKTKTKYEFIANVQQENWKAASQIMSIKTPEGKMMEFSVAEGGHLRLTLR